MSSKETSTTGTVAEPIDREALQVRYRAERDKRLREDGNDQYIEPRGRFAHFLDDPYVEPAERAPRHDEVTVAFIGGGFAGLSTGARLKEAGVDDVRIIEGGGDVGGAWYWNRYPGAMCDTAAMIYLPLLEETGHMPTQKYTMASEIFGHAQRIATPLRALRQRPVLDRGHQPRLGRRRLPLDHPHRPRRRDAGQVRGHGHRTAPPAEAARASPASRPSAGTASTPAAGTTTTPVAIPSGAPLDKLADKRVGIIGTGATAVQCIPHLARAAQELYVFQRTPSSIDVRNNHTIDPEWFATLEPGWQREWLTELHHPADRWLRRRGPGQGRLDRHLPAHPRPRHRRHGRRASKAPSSGRRRSCAPTRRATTRR